MSKSRRSVKPEAFSLFGVAEDSELSMFVLGAFGRIDRRRLGMFGIKLFGRLKGDLNGVQDMEVGLKWNASVDSSSATIGHILGVKPVISAVIDLAEPEYATALALANRQKPIYFHIAFDKPRYGHGPISTFSMSSIEFE